MLIQHRVYAAFSLVRSLCDYVVTISCAGQADEARIALRNASEGDISSCIESFQGQESKVSLLNVTRELLVACDPSTTWGDDAATSESLKEAKARRISLFVKLAGQEKLTEGWAHIADYLVSQIESLPVDFACSICEGAVGCAIQNENVRPHLLLFHV